MEEYVDKSQLGKQEGVMLITLDNDGQEIRTPLPESDAD